MKHTASQASDVLFRRTFSALALPLPSSGHRAAYGLVALVHHQIEGVDERGEPQLMDHRIRTHGAAAYRSVKRGESNGCHRRGPAPGGLPGETPGERARRTRARGLRAAPRIQGPGSGPGERKQGLPIQADAALIMFDPCRQVRRPRSAQTVHHARRAPHYALRPRL